MGKMKTTVEGVMPKPVTDEDVTKQLPTMTEYLAKAGAYWAFVAAEIEWLNAFGTGWDQSGSL